MFPVFSVREILFETVFVPEIIETTRLQLRKPRHEDADAMFAAYAQDPAVTRYLIWRPHPRISETHAVIDRFLEQWSAGTAFNWLLFGRDTHELVGSIGARIKDNGFDIGYLLAQPWWGKGLMVEAICAVTDWAFTQPSVSRVSAACDVENRASARALEKAGFRRERMAERYSIHPNISPDPRDCYLYAKMKSGSQL